MISMNSSTSVRVTRASPTEIFQTSPETTVTGTCCASSTSAVCPMAPPMKINAL